MLTQGEIVAKFAEKEGITAAEASRRLKVYSELVEDVLMTEGTFKLGVGTIKLSYRAPRTGVNPLTKEPLDIKENVGATFHLVPGFKLKAIENSSLMSALRANRK